MSKEKRDSMIVKELIQKTDYASVAHIWNKSYRFDQDKPYDERQLADALQVHLEMLLCFHSVPTQGVLLIRFDENQNVQVHYSRFEKEAPWPDSVEEILGLKIVHENLNKASDEQAIIAAILHQIFFKNQRGNERQENIA